MSDKTGIEWTDATWNPVTGCAKVSQGCKHCYAEREWPRMTKLVPAYAGRDFTDVRTHGDRIDQPIRWAKRRMIFVNSMSDLFHPAVPDDFIDSVFGVMWACLYGRNEQDGHILQVLTKRADRMRDYFRTDRREAWARSAVHHGGGIDPDGLWDQTMNYDGPHPRIWLGVSVEDQAAADERIPLLLDTPASVRWISAEPLLGPVDLGKWLDPWTCSDCGHHGSEFDTGQFMCADCGVEVEYAPEIGSGRCPNCGKDDGTSDDVGGTCPRCGSVRGWSRDCGFKFDAEKPAMLDWVVVGGESGPKARPMHPAWARSLRDQCAVAGVPFLFKQWGEWAPGENCAGLMTKTEATADWFSGKWSFGTMTPSQSEDCHIDDEPLLYRCGKKRAGRLLDGVQHDGYPKGGA